MKKNLSYKPIKIIIEGLGEIEGELIRFLAPRTVGAIMRRLPIESRAAIRKGAVCFQIPVKIGKEKARRNVKVGTIAYWPMGNALCCFYSESKPYSPVNPVGRISKNIDVFGQVRSGTRIRMEKREG